MPQVVADRRYERWVMRVAELVHGDYPEDREEAERVLLLRLRNGFVGSVPPSDLWGESTLEEGSAYFSEYGEDHLEAARSLVFALYSAAGGEEWSLVVDTVKDRATALVSVRGVSLDVKGVRVDLAINPNSLACEDASDVRDTREEMREVRAALENLWRVLAGIAAVEEDRRLRYEEGGKAEGKDTPETERLSASTPA